MLIGADMIIEEKTINLTKLYGGKILDLELHEVDIEGKIAKREIIRHARGAGIIAKLDDKFIFLDQFRKPFEGPILEIPAGKVDPDEDPLETAKRELREETGYRANKIEFLSEFLPSPGYSDEVVYLYYAEELQYAPLAKDEDENFKIYYLSEKEVMELIRNGRLKDGKSIAAFLLWFYEKNGR